MFLWDGNIAASILWPFRPVGAVNAHRVAVQWNENVLVASEGLDRALQSGVACELGFDGAAFDRAIRSHQDQRFQLE